MIPAEVQAQILTYYYTDKMSIRSISNELGINRKSVARVIKRRAVNLVPAERTRHSQSDPYIEIIAEHLRKSPQITGTALMNRLRTEGYTGGMSALRSYLRKVRGIVVRPREAFLRIEFHPGEVAQVDWGEFGDVFGDGVKIHCFAMVLAYSRMIYVEFTRSEKFEEFIRCHENAFRYFGGVPKECWYDNLRTAVTDRMGSLVKFNARFMAHMGHHGVRPHACNVAKGNEKGSVEDLIKYIRMNFWSGREFQKFEDLTKQFIVWRNQKANCREHRTTRRVIKLFFESEEKPTLLPMNEEVYDTEEIFSRNVSADFHIQYESNRYSVPWTLVGIVVTVRVNDRGLKVYYREKLICSHERSYLEGKVYTKEGHREGLLKRKPGAKREIWQLSYVRNLGADMELYIELIRRGERSLKYELSKLIALATVYGEEALVEGCKECLKLGIIGIDSLELHLRRSHHPSEAKLQRAPIKFKKEKLNRVPPSVDLRKYDALLFEANNSTGSAAKEIEDGKSTEQHARGRSERPETEVLESANGLGLFRNEGVRPETDREVSGPVDIDRESRETNAEN